MTVEGLSGRISLYFGNKRSSALQQFCCQLLLPSQGGLLLQPENPQQQVQQLKGREQVAHVRLHAMPSHCSLLLLLLLRRLFWCCSLIGILLVLLSVYLLLQHLLMQCVEPFEYCPMMSISFLCVDVATQRPCSPNTLPPGSACIQRVQAAHAVVVSRVADQMADGLGALCVGSECQTQRRGVAR